MFGCSARPDRWTAAVLALVLAACGQAGPTGSRPPPSSSAAGAPTSAGSPGAGASTSPVVEPPVAGSSTGSPPALNLAVVAGGLDYPVDVADPGDGSGRIFVVEQAGRIRIVSGDRLLDRPFVDLSDRVTSGGERGLLGLAFHPGFPQDPRFFVDYTDLEGNTAVSEFRVRDAGTDVADPASERILLHIDQPFANHNGGGVVFGPDGMLYISTGDGGSEGDPQNNGQRLDTLLGKILRIDVGPPDSGVGSAYTVPADNPFVAVAGARPEIWLSGLRNPWRIRFDPATGDLWIGDVGQNAWEEIDVARAGTNGLDFGWKLMEGFHCYSPSRRCDQQGLSLPIAEYGHDHGCAVIGGVVVRGSGQAGLDGRYVFADSCSGNVWTVDSSGDARREPALGTTWGGSISSIAEAQDGTVLATDLQRGQLLALSADAP